MVLFTIYLFIYLFSTNIDFKLFIFFLYCFSLYFSAFFYFFLLFSSSAVKNHAISKITRIDDFFSSFYNLLKFCFFPKSIFGYFLSAQPEANIIVIYILFFSMIIWFIEIKKFISWTQVIKVHENNYYSIKYNIFYRNKK